MWTQATDQLRHSKNFCCRLSLIIILIIVYAIPLVVIAAKSESCPRTTFNETNEIKVKEFLKISNNLYSYFYNVINRIASKELTILRLNQGQNLKILEK